jgi:hypothetical protein
VNIFRLMKKIKIIGKDSSKRLNHQKCGKRMAY